MGDRSHGIGSHAERLNAGDTLRTMGVPVVQRYRRSVTNRPHSEVPFQAAAAPS